MLRNILVAVSGSTASTQAIDRAVEVAAKFRFQMVAVTVIPRKALHCCDDASSASSDWLANENVEERAVRESTLASCEFRAKAAGVPLQTQVVISDSVANGILNASRQLNSAMIVMGQVKGGWLRRALHDHKLRRVLSHAGVPVLVVH